MADPEERYAEFRQKLDALLQEFEAEAGPAKPYEGEDVGHCWPTEWVLVSGWVTETGLSSIARIGSSGLVSWHRDGMLHEALYGNWSGDEDEADD